MKDGLPKGWTGAPLDVLCDRVRGVSYQRDEASPVSRPGYVPILRANNLEADSLRFDDLVWVPAGRVSPNQKLRAGDVVVAMSSGSKKVVGKTGQALSDWNGAFGAFCGVLRPAREMHSRYIGLFLRTQKYRSEISDLAAGTNINNLKAEHFAQILVPLAPFAEQRRIVAKLEQLLATVDTCQQRLTRVPVLLKRFRQSVLAAACSGRLTADWREENPDVVDAAPLVQRIDEARRRRSLGRVRLASVEVLDGDDRPEDEIPSSWKWVRFGSVIGELRNGISPRPSVTPPGTPVLRISAARSGSVDLTDVRYMPNGLEFLPLFAVRDDDLLFTRYNGSIELLGVCGRVRGLGRKAMLYPDKLMRVRFDHEVILPAYAEVFFQVQAVHERIVAKSKSSAGQNGVSGSDIKAQPFALAPIPEQQEIVRRVEGLFSLGDQIESRLVGVLTQVARLAPSLLAKAFRGELVPTEAELARREGRDYEPASVLLERVQQQHDSEPARRSRHRAESSSGNAELKGQQARRAVIRR